MRQIVIIVYLRGVVLLLRMGNKLTCALAAVHSQQHESEQTTLVGRAVSRHLRMSESAGSTQDVREAMS